MVECVPMATHAFVLKIRMERDASFVSHSSLVYAPFFHPKMCADTTYPEMTP